MSMTSSRKRTQSGMTSREALPVEAAAGRRRRVTKLARLSEPRLQDSYGRSGCSPHGLVASIAPRFGVGLSRLMRSRKTMPGSPFCQALATIRSKMWRARTALPVQPSSRRRWVDELVLFVVLDGAHEVLGDGDGDVEVGERAHVRLEGDELLDVGVVDVQDAHVGAAAGAALLDRLGGRVEHLEERHGAGGDAHRRAHAVAFGPQAGEGEAGAAAGLVDDAPSP